MMHEHQLESRLEQLLHVGTIAFSVIIAIGIAIDAIESVSAPVDLVTIGIVGFIILPVMRLLTMLAHYIRTKDIPVTRVVGLVLTLIFAGVVLGIIW